MATRKILVTLVFIFFSLTAVKASPVSARRFDSIYQFGDGFSDTGNLMIESPTYATRCSYTPYGMSISDHPTGRCSDGLLIIDYFARSFNLPSPFPYLGLQDPYADLEHGFNFAMDGGTALDTQPDYLRKSLNYQLSWFKESLSSSCPNSLHGAECKNKLSKALFVIGEIGANDYKDSKLAIHDIFDNLIPQVVASVINATKLVIDHGGVNLIVPGIYPLGCMPDVIYHYSFEPHQMSHDSLGCLNQFNEISKVHNEQLKQGLNELQKQHPNVAIHYGDYYSAFTWILQNAASLGFEGDDVVTKKCCDFPCGFNDTKVCKEPRKMISWDGTHLTQQAYSHMAQWLLQDMFSKASPPPQSMKSASPASPIMSSFSKPMRSASPASPVTSSFSAQSPLLSHSGAAGTISMVLIQALMVSTMAFWGIGSRRLF